METPVQVSITPSQVRSINNIISLIKINHTSAFRDDIARVETWIAEEIYKIKN